MEKSEETDIDLRHPELWDEPDHIRREMVRTMSHIYCHGMTTISGGNISVIDSIGNIWITPSGTDKGSLKPEEVVCVAPDGVFEGPLKPSMEYPLHRAVYDARPDIRAMIHAHPPLLTSFSILHQIPDTSVINEWRQICGQVGYAAYAIPGSMAMGQNVAAEFMKGHDAVIMENHAIVAGGEDIAKALARLEALEFCATTLHAATALGEISIPDHAQNDNPELPAGSQLPPPGPGLHPGETDSALTPEEEQLADEICRMASRACDRGLMYGFCGTVSARAAGDRFLITRERVLRCDIRKTGIAGTDNTGTGLNTWLHVEIYHRLPSVNAVIMARPPWLMAFAVTAKEIDVRTIPESWILLQELPLLPLQALQQGRGEIFDMLAGGIPALMIANDSVIVTGESLMQAFDRLEVAEMTAMSLILGKSLGSVSPLSDANIDELRRVFFSK